MSYAHGYYAFPKLEGDIGPHMVFRGQEDAQLGLNNYLGLANHPGGAQADAEGAAQFGMAAPMGARMMSGQTVYHERLSVNWPHLSAKRTPSCSLSVTRA